MSGYLLGEPKFMAFDNNGDPLVGGKLYSYHPDTSNPKNTYSNIEMTSANTNPITLDARGEALVFLNGETKLILKDSLGNTIWTVDNVSTGFGIGDTVYPEWFGAVGDGTTDDTIPLQAAINASTCVALSSKTYKITDSLTVPANTVIYGTGPLSVIHRTTVGCGIYPYNNVALRNLTLHHPNIPTILKSR